MLGKAFQTWFLQNLYPESNTKLAVRSDYIFNQIMASILVAKRLMGLYVFCV